MIKCLFFILPWTIFIFLAGIISWPWLKKWLISLWAKFWAWVSRKIIDGLMGGDKK